MASLAVSAFAQRDIKSFDNLSPEGVISILGNPIEVDYNWLRIGDERVLGDACLTYDRTTIVINGGESYSLDYFCTEDSQFCVLSDYISGGIKVGDPLNKLQSYVFVNSVYGRGKPENGLLLIDSNRYAVFFDEYQRLFFTVIDNLIVKIEYSEAEDLPYPNYDFSNKLFAAQIDISRFNKVGEQEISAIINCPEETWGVTDIDCYPKFGDETKYGFGPSGCELVISPQSKELLYFSTNTSNYCVLSDIVPGGIKVGTKLSDLEDIDFVNSRYGRGKQGNSFRFDQRNNVFGQRYVIFGEEYQSVVLYFKNGLVTSFVFCTSEADIEYDKSISIFP